VEKDFKQDGRYKLGILEAEDVIIHEGPDFVLNLNPNYLSYEPFQQEESILLPFKLEEWEREVGQLMREGKLPEDARIIVIRRRFPLKVNITEGVVWSSKHGVVVESLGKIPKLQQQKIQGNRIFVTSSSMPTTQRTAEQARIESQRLELEDEEEEEDFALRVNTQAKPMTRIPLQRSASFSQAEQPGPSTSSASKRPRVDNNTVTTAQISVGPQANHNDLMFAVEAIKAYFSRDLFDQFKVPFDRNGANIPEKKVDGKQLEYSYKNYHHRQDMATTNTTKMSSEVFGQGQCQINLYKCKNALTGNRVPFSLREGAQILEQIALNMIFGLKKLAVHHKENELKLAKNLTGQEREEAILHTTIAFTEKMQKLGL